MPPSASAETASAVVPGFSDAFQVSVIFRLASPPPSTSSAVSLPVFALNAKPTSTEASCGRAAWIASPSSPTSA